MTLCLWNNPTFSKYPKTVKGCLYSFDPGGCSTMKVSYSVNSVTWERTQRLASWNPHSCAHRDRSMISRASSCVAKRVKAPFSSGSAWLGAVVSTDTTATAPSVRDRQNVARGPAAG